jgi:ADP-ribose pyrophosphatase YjhB (NUDIX family)
MAFIPPTPFAWNYCGICGARLVEADDGQSLRPHCPGCRRFYYRNPVPAACLFVRNEAGHLLLAQRAVEPAKGCWTLPGGFVELGETTEEAALRELLEETGLRATLKGLLGVSTKQSPISGAVMVLGYLVEHWEGELHAATDVSDLKWFAKAERPEVPFSAHRDLLAIYDALYPEAD